MPTTVSDYFTEELMEWSDSIEFYLNEIKSFSLKLGDVVKRNSIIGIAEKVEAHQIRLNQMSEKFYRIQSVIRKQEINFRSDLQLIDDAKIRRESENQQVDLRVKMHEIEKEYIEIKYDCYHFLAGVLKK